MKQLISNQLLLSLRWRGLRSDTQDQHNLPNLNYKFVTLYEFEFTRRIFISISLVNIMSGYVVNIERVSLVNILGSKEGKG